MQNMLKEYEFIHVIYHKFAVYVNVTVLEARHCSEALFEPVVGIGLVVESFYLLISSVSVQLDGFDEGAVRFQVNDRHSRFPGLVLQSL